MKIGGLEKFSLIDYPGHISAVIFTVGCNFRCPFCYNPMLVLPIKMGEEKNSSLSKDKNLENGQTLIEYDLFHFLKSRLGKLDGVVISGGEPTLQADLLEFIRKIKDIGFDVKLDTNGTNPAMLRPLISEGLIDYIAMDLKSDQSGYRRSTGIDFNFAKIKESVKIIQESGLPHEFRTTCVPGFLDEAAIENMGQIIDGSDKWFLQRFKSDAQLLDSSLSGQSCFPDDKMERFAAIGRKHVKICEIRG